jgi:hypothetical protein
LTTLTDIIDIPLGKTTEHFSVSQVSQNCQWFVSVKYAWTC